MMSKPPRIRLEGWLLKKKSKEKSSVLFKNENLRWFRIQELEGSDRVELALCYYGAQKDKEAKGWIYLKDVTHIYDDKKTFTVVSNSRTMTLEAQSPPEHILWIQALANYCPNASHGIQVKSSERSERKEDKYSEQEIESLHSYPKNLAAENKQSLPSLFSRYAQGEKQSFYTQENADRKKLPSLNSASEDLEYGEPEMVDPEQVASSLDCPPADQFSHPSSSSQRNQKDDHRMRGYRGSDISSSTTSRLHRFITKEATDNGTGSRREVSGDDNELESMVLPDEPTSRAKTMKHSQESSRSTFDSSLPIEDEQRIAANNYNDENKEIEQGPSSRTEDRESKASSRRAGKPGSFPLPTNAPPRRARDALLEAEASQQKARRSIDDVLFKKDDSRQNSARNSVSENRSSSDEEFDLKAEIKKYHGENIGEFMSNGPSSSKPPKIPAGSAPVKSSVNIHHRSGTPPRPISNPGTQVDQNFLTEDWDDEDRNQMHTKNSKPSSNSRLVKANYSSVQADDNWLNEDFDS